MVTYQGQQYFVISTYGEIVEIAPTSHGAGSFMVHQNFLKAA